MQTQTQTESAWQQAFKAEWCRQFRALSAQDQEIVLNAPDGITSARLAASVESTIAATTERFE